MSQLKILSEERFRLKSFRSRKAVTNLCSGVVVEMPTLSRREEIVSKRAKRRRRRRKITHTMQRKHIM